MLFKLFFKHRLNAVLPSVFDETNGKLIEYRKLNREDLPLLERMLASQEPEDLKYFNPHSFELYSLEVQLRKPAFLMMCAFAGQKLIGYFFLRFFINKQCFVGRLIDREYRGKGMGSSMNFIMYETAWRMGFRCLSTISRNNKSVMQAHAKNRTMIILKELQNNYLLVEFVKEKMEKEKGERKPLQLI